MMKWKMEWDASMSVGVEKIDTQHKELFAKINDLLSALASGNGTAKIQEVVGFLESYTRKHFDTEENCMRRYSYPECDDHFAEHKAFIDDIHKLQDELKAGSKDALQTLKVQRRVCDWIVTHIANTDTKLGSYLKNNERASGQIAA